jgi:hypothetical protein
MSDLLQKLAAAHKAKTEAAAASGGTTLVVPLFATSGVTESREAPRKREVAATDVLDAHRHAFSATVLSCNKHQNAKCQGMSELVVAITAIESNGSPVIATSPETGNTFLLATAKDPPPSGQKIKLPRYIAPECAIVRIDGVVKLSLSNGRNGPRGGDFKPEEVPIGTKVKLTGVNLNYKLSKPTVDNPTPTGAVYLEAETIEVLAKPSFPTDGATAATGAVIRECPGALVQAAIDTDSEMGSSNSNLQAIAMKDRIFLAGFLENIVEKYDGAKVGVGEIYERFLVSPDDTKTSIEDTVEHLRDEHFIHIDPVDAFPLDSSNTRCPAFVQHCPGLLTKHMLRYKDSGFGALVTIRKPTYDPDGEIGDLAVGEMTLIARDERTDGVATPLTKPIKFNLLMGVASRASVDKTFDESIAMVGDMAMATHLPLLTTKRLKDDFGVFDIGRLHDVALELIPQANVVFFPKIETRTTSTFDIAIVSPDGEWGRERTIIDVVAAVRDIGVKVSKEFVMAALVDEDDALIKPALDLFASDHNDGASKMQKKSPTLDSAGYCALNSGKIERSFTTLIKRLPEGSCGVEFFVIFPGVSELHDETTKLNTNETAGDAMIKSMHPSKKMLDAFVLNKCVVYAIATKTKKRKAEEASSSDEATAVA